MRPAEKRLRHREINSKLKKADLKTVLKIYGFVANKGYINRKSPAVTELIHKSFYTICQN